MWRMNELTEWAKCQAPTRPVSSAAPAPLEELPEAVAKRVRLDVEKIAGMMDAEADTNRKRAETENALAKRLRAMRDAEKKPSTNGDGH
jgi:hypothetical protein